MKNSRNTIRTIVAAAAVLFTVAASNQAMAINENGNLPVDVKYVGTSNNTPVFQLNFSNEQVEEFVITIRDKYNTVYTETVKGTGQLLSRKYQFVNEGTSDDDNINIEVRNVRTNKVINYTIDFNNAVMSDRSYIATK